MIMVQLFELSFFSSFNLLGASLVKNLTKLRIFNGNVWPLNIIIGENRANIMIPCIRALQFKLLLKTGLTLIHCAPSPLNL